METMIRIKRLKAGTLFKLLFTRNVMFFVPISSILGILSFFGLATISWNEQVLTGWKAVVASPLIGLFIAILFSIVMWIALGFGLWLFSLFASMDLEYIPPND
ncbi:hypothetical protein [Nitratifractor sp.]